MYYVFRSVITKIKLDKREINQYSPLALAFLGDVIYEKLVREYLTLKGNMPVAKLHKLSVEKVCAEYQARAVKLVKPMLNEGELDVLRRGRNASGINAPKHSTVAEYRHATSLECLFGYLHLSGNEERVEEIFNIIWNMPDEFERSCNLTRAGSCNRTKASTSESIKELEE